jgi:hypothetical protein
MWLEISVQRPACDPAYDRASHGVDQFAGCAPHVLAVMDSFSAVKLHQATEDAGQARSAAEHAAAAVALIPEHLRSLRMLPPMLWPMEQEGLAGAAPAPIALPERTERP